MCVLRPAGADRHVRSYFCKLTYAVPDDAKRPVLVSSEFESDARHVFLAGLSAGLKCCYPAATTHAQRVDCCVALQDANMSSVGATSILGNQNWRARCRLRLSLGAPPSCDRVRGRGRARSAAAPGSGGPPLSCPCSRNVAACRRASRPLPASHAVNGRTRAKAGLLFCGTILSLARRLAATVQGFIGSCVSPCTSPFRLS